MTELTVNMELSPGTTIEGAAFEACQVATRIRVGVGFKHSDVECIALPDGDWRELVGLWYLIMAGCTNNHVAFAHPKEKR